MGKDTEIKYGIWEKKQDQTLRILRTAWLFSENNVLVNNRSHASLELLPFKITMRHVGFEVRMFSFEGWSQVSTRF